MASRLTPDQVEHYRREGYVIFDESVLSIDQFNRLKEIFDDNLQRYGPDDLDVPHFRDARLLEFLLADEILDLVEPVVGPDIGLWSSHFISKAPMTGKRTPWHEDSAYWNGRLSTMEGICTIWLAIDKADRENGCMRVIPRSHSGGFSDYQKIDGSEAIFGSEIKADQVAEETAVDLELEPNSCSLHEARIIHGAEPNTSDRRRAGYTMRYFPLTTKVFREKNYRPDGSHHKIWIARGRDRAGNEFENVVWSRG